MENQNNELELMRQQLAILNKKLESETIINARLMREAMKHKMSWIKKFLWGEIIAIPILILFFGAVTVAFHLSYGPLILMTVMMIVSVFFDYKINMIDDRDFLKGNLADTALRLAQMKRRRKINELASFPFLFIWVAWFSYDLYKHIPADGIWHFALTGALVGGLVGCVIGGVSALFIFRKMQRTNDELIRQIDELR